MANRIKGITIKIGGDTTKLSKALEGVNKNIRNTQTQLKEVPFKASAAVPRLYRIKFRRDIYKDFAALQTSVQEGDEEGSNLDIESLEVFENIAYIMAKHAAPENVPDNPDEWLEAFNTFSIYEVLPQLIELWGLNVETQAESKKNIEKLTAR